MNINNKFTEVLFLSKGRKKYYLDWKFHYEKGTDNMEDKDKYINYIVENIKRHTNNVKLRNIYFYMQNDEIIIRNMENVSIKKKKDIIPLIKYEINKYIPIDLQNYIIKYKKITDFNDKNLVQGILFPKKFVHICNEIGEKLEIKKKYLNINFDILQKILDMNLINLCSLDKKIIVIENRQEDMILNKIYNNKIIESYLVDKSEKSNILSVNDEENIYYFGINDDYMKNIQAKEITIKNKLLLDSNKEVIDENNHYLCAWGMII